MSRLRLIFLLLAGFLIVGCGADSGIQDQPPGTEPPAQTPGPEPEPDPTPPEAPAPEPEPAPVPTPEPPPPPPPAPTPEPPPSPAPEPPPAPAPEPEPAPPPDPPAAPSSLTVVKIGSRQVILEWNNVPGATSYSVYYATQSGFFPNGTRIQGLTSPATIGGLNNNTSYHFVVTASNAGGESGPSSQAGAMPSEREPTANEVRMIELVNRARFDPEAEVARNNQVNSVNEGTPSGCTITPAQKAPLAFNQLLLDAAENHSHWMLANDTFSHTGVNGSNPGNRVTAAGYSWSWVGENLAVSSTLNIDHQHNGLFASPGHRCNILHEQFREIGVGQDFGPFTFTQGVFHSSMVTQKYARPSSGSFFITGVVYQDNNSNGIYDQNEGIANVVVNVNGTNHLAYTSGIYSVPVGNNNTYTITFSGGALPEPVATDVTINGRNVKVDAVVSGGSVDLVVW